MQISKNKRRRSATSSVAAVAAVSLVAALFGSLLAAAPYQATDDQAGGREQNESRVRVRRDEEADRTELVFEARAGYILWSDVAAALAELEDFDASALPGGLRWGLIDLNSRKTALALAATDAALGRGVRFAIRPPAAEGAEPSLVLDIDHREWRNTRRRFKSRFALLLGRAFNRGGDSGDYGLTLDRDWQSAAIEKRLVVLAHGLQSSPEKRDDILETIRQRGYPCATFRYPNDQSIEASAVLLSDELRRVALDQPKREVAILSTSMGGLVAREAVENPDLDPGNVRQLVMVAPPSHGSQLAQFAFGMDVLEHFVGQGKGPARERLFSAVADGLNEASHDLRPDSPFLRELNSRPRNPQIRYTIFLGTGGPCQPEEVTAAREKLQASAARNRFVQFFEPRLENVLSDLDEVVVGKGDTAVAVKRGRLDGVDDTVLLAFDHIGMMDDPDNPDSVQLRREILKRITGSE